MANKGSLMLDALFSTVDNELAKEQAFAATSTSGIVTGLDETTSSAAVANMYANTTAATKGEEDNGKPRARSNITPSPQLSQEAATVAAVANITAATVDGNSLCVLSAVADLLAHRNPLPTATAAAAADSAAAKRSGANVRKRPVSTFGEKCLLTKAATAAATKKTTRTRKPRAKKATTATTAAKGASSKVRLGKALKKGRGVRGGGSTSKIPGQDARHTTQANANSQSYTIEEKRRIRVAIESVNATYGHLSKNEREEAWARLRGITMRPSCKWQAQLYYANKSRYIGVFETREKASLAYEIAREILDKNKKPARSGSGVSLASEHAPMTEDETKRNFALAQKASYEGVTEIVARNPSLGNNFGKSSEELRKEYTDILKKNEL